MISDKQLDRMERMADKVLDGDDSGDTDVAGYVADLVNDLRALRADQTAAIEAAFLKGFSDGAFYGTCDYDEKKPEQCWQNYRAQLEKGGTCQSG